MLIHCRGGKIFLSVYPQLQQLPLIVCTVCPNKSTNSSIYLLVADVIIVVVSDRRRGKKDDQQKYYWWYYSITYLIHSISRERKRI